jgi:hypothetical protein
VDFIVELRKRRKYEAQEDMTSTKNPNKEATFGKFYNIVTIRGKERATALDHYLFV